MSTKINERIKVMAGFKDGKIIPYFFDWNSRRYKITSLNLYHEQSVGDIKIRFFSVTTNEGEYLISFNPDTNNWQLTESLA